MKRSIFLSNGAAIELRNCAQEATTMCHQHNNKINHQIEEAIALGMFVVVERYPWYCRATDALVGSGLSVAHIAPTRQDAIDWISNQYYKDPASFEQSDSSFDILPADPVQVDCGGEPIETDEVPF